MPKKKIDIIRQLSNEKNQFIVDQLDKWEGIVNAASFSLFDTLLREFLRELSTEDGALQSDEANIRKVALIENAWKKFQAKEGFRVINTFVNDLSEIIALGKNYYLELIPNQVQGNAIEKILNERLGIKWAEGEWTPKPNGYIDSLMKDRTIITDIKKIAYNNIIPKKGYNTLMDSISAYLKGRGEEPGKYYKFYKTYAFDTYSNIDRLNSSMHAERLDLKYFLFNGGLVRDSRQFCIDHHGKCFSDKEAEKWKDLIGKYKLVPGKRKAQIKVPIGPIVEDKETYDPIRDLGGILCRHSADFVSTEIAEELRKKNV